MIKILAPTTVESADDPTSTTILEMDRETFRALRAAVQVAFEDPHSIPEEFEREGSELWDFFAHGIQAAPSGDA